MAEMITATIFKIIFRSEDGYKVALATVKGRSGTHTITGTYPEFQQDTKYKFTGEWTIHPKYGEQFKFTGAEEMMPESKTGIVSYLASGLIKGVKRATAKKIVNAFGEQTLDILDETPERLTEVPGIGEKKAAAIIEALREKHGMRKAMVFLGGYGIGMRLATKIYNMLGNDTVAKIRENPYCITDIRGIGFKTADEMAQKLGVSKESYNRLNSGIKYTLLELSKDGHCYATQDMLVAKGMELLGVDGSLIVMTLDEMIRTEAVITETPDRDDGARAIFLPMFYYAEVGTANSLKRIAGNPLHGNRKTLKLSDIEYDPVQEEAIRTAVNSKVFILTGGPGTGKTTTTLGIINSIRKGILLAAPTGRAAKRLSEATGREALTIHRLLGAKPDGTFAHDDKNPLYGNALVVDECSMIDIILMNRLLKAVPDSMQVILVGDVDQLPSVGPGNVLRDIINSGEFPVVKLEKIFRQAEGSRIIQNAHRVNKGIIPDCSPEGSDFFFMNADTYAKKAGKAPEGFALEEIGELVAKKLPEYFNVPPEQIQVLSPMKQRQLGTVQLNQYLQNRLNPIRNKWNPDGERITFGAVEYRRGDKVMQVVNNYDKGVFNGDLGYVSEVDSETHSLTVDFDGIVANYKAIELEELSLAYAVTIHKSQGSEYPVVVMPFFMSHYIMLQRNLLYTGITRAKQGFVMVGQKKAMAYAVSNNVVVKRNTMLEERLHGDNGGKPVGQK